MATSQKLSSLAGKLEQQVAMARFAYERGHTGLARHDVRVGADIIDQLIVTLEQVEGANGMDGISTPLLDKRSYRVGKRLVRHYGGELEAERWLSEPRSVPPFNGMTPAAYFELDGESWFQDATCEWPLEDTHKLRATNVRAI